MTDIPKLVCLGHLTLNGIVRPQGELSATTLGGSALYGALAARLFEARSEMVAPLGRDFPQRGLALLAAAGFRGEALPIRDKPTPRLLHPSHASHDTLTPLRIVKGAPAEMAPRVADVPQRFWRSKAFMIMAMPLRMQSALVNACQARADATRGISLQYKYIIGKRNACLALVSRIDVLLAGSAEVAYLLGPLEPATAARQLAAMGPAVVAIDVGAQNHLVYDRKTDHMYSQPAYPVAPVDPTGGADAFGAAFMACLLQTSATVRWAAAAAAVAASFAVSAHGADGALAAGPVDAARRLALFVRPGRK